MFATQKFFIFMQQNPFLLRSLKFIDHVWKVQYFYSSREVTFLFIALHYLTFIFSSHLEFTLVEHMIKGSSFILFSKLTHNLPKHDLLNIPFFSSLVWNAAFIIYQITIYSYYLFLDFLFCSTDWINELLSDQFKVYSSIQRMDCQSHILPLQLTNGWLCYFG